MMLRTSSWLSSAPTSKGRWSATHHRLVQVEDGPGGHGVQPAGLAPDHRGGDGEHEGDGDHRVHERHSAVTLASVAMRIALAADHAGYPLKVRVAEHLRAAGHDVADL